MLWRLADLGLLCLCLSSTIGAAERTFTVRDSLKPAPAATDDVRDALNGLVWTPGEFTATRIESDDPAGHTIIRFPSAVQTGDAINDQVALVWYHAAVDDGASPFPAMVVVHESGSAMPVGKLFAQAFAAQGVHSFLIHLPYYGLRRREGVRPDDQPFQLLMRQAIADVRRARDVVAALPEVDSRRISLQGTSLGGFVSAAVTGVDQGYDATYIMLAGGDLMSLLENGVKEAAQLRQRLERAGYTGEKLRQMLHTIEPTRIAQRCNPETTWLYTAEQDKVVPLANALAFQRAAGLSDDHHIRLWGDHTSTIVYFPIIIKHVVEHLPVGHKP